VTAQAVRSRSKILTVSPRGPLRARAGTRGGRVRDAGRGAVLCRDCGVGRRRPGAGQRGLGLPACAVPDLATIRRVLTSVDPAALDAAVGSWVSARLAAAGHRKIENQLHWVRDVTYLEDKSLVRAGNAPRVMATLRSLAISPAAPGRP
jgi:hypothetical protein